MHTGALPGAVVRNHRAPPAAGVGLPELLPDEYLVLDQAAPVADTAANFEAVLDGADVLGPSAVGKRERDATAAKL